MTTLAEFEVFEANAEFYNAIREGSIDRLSRICHTSPDAGCIHPSRGLIQGWGRIALSWEQIFNMSEEVEDVGLASAGAAARISIGLQPETVKVNLPPGSGVAW